MIPNPIRKVLSTMRTRQVQALLMGGQACVFYGGAEFSRDTDLVVLAEAENLGRLAGALEDLQAEGIAVPPFDPSFLVRGHAVHFRCRHSDAPGMRVDIMSVLRGVAPFPELWRRRTSVTGVSGESYELLALPDLVRAKKTQREKDWLMVRRLLEADFFRHRHAPEAGQVAFWFQELRTPELLIGLAHGNPGTAAGLAPQRPLLTLALEGSLESLDAALAAEAQREKAADRAYWAPLKAELEELRWRRSRDRGAGGEPDENHQTPP